MGASPTSPHRAVIELAALASGYLRRHSEAGGGISCTADSPARPQAAESYLPADSRCVRRSGGVGHDDSRTQNSLPRDSSVRSLLDRGLMRLDANLRPPRLFFTDAGLVELRAMIAVSQIR
jgi:hypothetical protein